MSIKCGFSVPGKPKTNKWDNTQHKRFRPCGRDPSMFLRVEYSELAYYREGEGKYKDIFGFCQEHGEFMAVDAKLWLELSKRRPRVYGLRGTVKSVDVVDPSEIPDPKELGRQEERLRTMAACKSDFKRRMNQKNTEKLRVEDWRILFEECLDEWVVEAVHNS